MEQRGGEAMGRMQDLDYHTCDGTRQVLEIALNGDAPQTRRWLVKRMAQLELEENRRQGRRHFSAECPERRHGGLRSRAHRRQREVDRPGGELSLDISGPHMPGRWPSDTPESWGKRAQYFLIASYRVFTDDEQKLDVLVQVL